MKLVCLLALVGVIGGGPVAAHAANSGIEDGNDSGFFAGGSVGQSRLRVSSPELEGSGNTQETGFKVFAGYRLNPYLSFEGAYYDPGKFSEAEDGDSLTLEADLVQFSAIGSYPIAGHVDLFARLGITYWDATLTGSSDGETGSLSDNGTQLNWGVGIAAHLSDNVSVRAELDQTEIDQALGDLPVTWRLRFFSVGVSYRF
jgi:opacity protein-like surface antigen